MVKKLNREKQLLKVSGGDLPVIVIDYPGKSCSQAHWFKDFKEAESFMKERPGMEFVVCKTELPKFKSHWFDTDESAKKFLDYAIKGNNSIEKNYTNKARSWNWGGYPSRQETKDLSDLVNL